MHPSRRKSTYRGLGRTDWGPGCSTPPGDSFHGQLWVSPGAQVAPCLTYSHVGSVPGEPAALRRYDLYRGLSHPVRPADG